MKSMKSTLTIDAVRHALDFDPAVGVFVWKNPQSNAVKAGEPAGVIAANGRRYINVGGEKHMAHRLAWFYIHGEWPTGDVKNANGDYDDCREANLVHQSRQVTAATRRVNAASKSGYPGITWDKKRGKWQVHITRDYKQVALGLFAELEAAVSVRATALAETAAAADPAAREAAAHNISRRRRQRVAWNKLVASGAVLGWSSLDEFCVDVGDIPQTKVSIVAIDAAAPVGPGNFRWSLPLDKKHDFQTREGRAAYGKAHRAANPALYREKELQKNFSIGSSEYEAMLAAQDGVCDICKKPEDAVIRGKVIHLSVDHDHSTGKIRGLLCGQCNHAIGKFGDDVGLLQSAADYLRKHAAPAPFMCDNPGRDWLHVATPGFGA